MSSELNSDFLVIGGGIIGISIARALRRRYPDCSVTLLEKESSPGQHATGRNSGVLHAGFYYTADSLKARFCRDGNRAFRAYLEERKIPLNQCGKLVVARSAEELPQLDELLRRAQANGVALHSLTAEEARQIEPRAKTFQRALFSPTTATADPKAVIGAVTQDAISEKVRLKLNTRYQGRRNGGVITSDGIFSGGFVVNAAGLYADRVALDFGFSQNHRILPFKGLYLYSDEPPGAFRTNIYPVPDLRNPFLGVHFTLLADGSAKIGPTAIPAFWREQYQGFERFQAAEFAEILWRDIGLLLFAGFDFRNLAWEELRKQSKARMVALASELAENVRLADYRSWGKPGIRAQLVNIKLRKLEMDFVLEGDSQSLHVLNAVSPAWTCSLPFAEHVCDRIAALTGRN